jgi:hypothetical protein
MNLFKAFDRVSIINLPHRQDRRNETIAELSLFGQQVDGRHIHFFPAIRPEGPGEFPTTGTRGCFLSHREIIRKAIADDLERILVLEDDVNFAPGLARQAEALEKALRDFDWDIAYLGHRLKGDLGPGPLPIWTHDIVCAHCYALSRRGMRSLLPYLDAVLRRPAGHPEGGAMHYDGALNMWRTQFAPVCRVANPSVARQRSSRTDVHQNGLRDRLPVVRHALATARRLKNAFLRSAKRRQLR